MEYKITESLYDHSKNNFWGKELTCSIGNSNLCIAMINTRVYIIWIASRYDISILAIVRDKLPYFFNISGSSYPVILKDSEDERYIFSRINSNTIKISSGSNTSIKIIY